MLSLEWKEEVKIMQVIIAAVYILDDLSMYVKKAQNNRYRRTRKCYTINAGPVALWSFFPTIFVFSPLLYIVQLRRNALCVSFSYLSISKKEFLLKKMSNFSQRIRLSMQYKRKSVGWLTLVWTTAATMREYY